MKGNVVRGSGFRGALEYVCGKDETPDIVGGNMAGTTPRQLSAEFSVSRQLRPDIKKPVWHCSLALPAGEVVTPEKWGTIAQDMMLGMGMDPDNHQFTAARHHDTEFDHIHIVASRIGLDGSVWHGKWEARRAIETTQALEKKHGLTITPGLENKNDDKRLTRGEINKAVRTEQEPPRQALRRILDAAVEGKPTAVEFAERVEAAGVEVRANLASTGKMSGFSFGYQGESYAAGRVADRFRWGKLSKKVIYVEDRDREELEQFTNCAKAGPGDKSGSPVATATDRDRPADQPDSRDHGVSDSRQFGGHERSGAAPAYRDQRDPENNGTAGGGRLGSSQRDSAAPVVGSDGRNTADGGERLRQTDPGTGRTDPGGDEIDGHDQRSGENRDAQINRLDAERTGALGREDGRRQPGRRGGQEGGREGWQAGPGRQHTRPQHRQIDGSGHGPVGLAGVVGDLRHLAQRHVVTPEKARQRIARVIEADPAPIAHDSAAAPTTLKRWYQGVKKKLKEVIGKAWNFFTTATEDSAIAAGWEPDKMAEAGLEGRIVLQYLDGQREIEERKALEIKEAETQARERKPESDGPDELNFDSDDEPGGPRLG